MAAGVDLVSSVNLADDSQELSLGFALRPPLLLELLYVVHHFDDVGDRLKLHR